MGCQPMTYLRAIVMIAAMPAARAKPCFLAQIPPDFIGRALSQDETADLLSMLTIGAGYKARSDQSEAAAA
jgi:hypothetical protein